MTPGQLLEEFKCEEMIYLNLSNCSCKSHCTLIIKHVISTGSVPLVDSVQ